MFNMVEFKHGWLDKCVNRFSNFLRFKKIHPFTMLRAVAIMWATDQQHGSHFALNLKNFVASGRSGNENQIAIWWERVFFWHCCFGLQDVVGVQHMLRNPLIQRGVLNLLTIYFEDMPVPEKKSKTWAGIIVTFPQQLHSIRSFTAHVTCVPGWNAAKVMARRSSPTGCYVRGAARWWLVEHHIYRQQTWSRLQYRIGWNSKHPQKEIALQTLNV